MRADVPEERWFWGLSYAELRPVLRRLTGLDAGQTARHELLRYGADDPIRAFAVRLNRASQQIVQQRWFALRAGE